MSEVKVDTISERTPANGVAVDGVTIKDSGITISSGGTLQVDGTLKAANGILFGTDTAAANTLDDYEEGTWTPVLSFGGGSTGITYNTQTGFYTKVGRIAIATTNISLSSKGSSTGTAEITLPFTSGNVSEQHFQPYLVTVTSTGNVSIFARSNLATSRFVQFSDAGSATFMTDSNFANNSFIRATLVYQTA